MQMHAKAVRIVVRRRREELDHRLTRMLGVGNVLDFGTALGDRAVRVVDLDAVGAPLPAVEK
jgi:hypothetical protein